MSLINDALKRAQEVQQQTTPVAGGPALRPADPAQTKVGSGARILLFIMVLAVILGNFLIWVAFRDRSVQKPNAPATAPVQAQVTRTPPVTPGPAAEPVPVPVEAVVAAPSTGPNTIPEVLSATTVVEEASADAVTTNAPGPEPKVVFAEPPKLTVLRLQSIIYGSRPSAMIAGRFLFVGDSIQGHQVVAIDKASVTLVGEGQTNVLSLP
jgi:hypothetical protein